VKLSKYDSEITYTSVSENGTDKKRFLEDVEKLEKILEKYSSLIEEEDKSEISILVNKFKQI
jgi:hypothetical protein